MINKAGNQAQAGRNKAGNGRLKGFSALSPAAQSVFLLIRNAERHGIPCRIKWMACLRQATPTDKISPRPAGGTTLVS
ncbi:hypothetical protein [Microvirgula curvata]